MSTPVLEAHREEASTEIPRHEFDTAEITEQLDRVISSTHFRNSKRYPQFLTYVVKETLAGNTEALKERTLGTEVFSRKGDYDTNADPVVRVTAGEIRKRIAQYYQAPGHEHELRIDLPLGSYVPHFYPAASIARATGQDRQEDHGAATPVVPPASEEDAVTHLQTAAPRLTRFGRIALGSTLGLLVLAAAGYMATLWTSRPADPGTSYFWKPLLVSKSPALIVIGVHTLDKSGNDLPPATYAGSETTEQQSMLASEVRADMVPIDDLISYSKLTDLLTQKNHSYQSQGATNTTLENLRHGPVILVGGLDNIWTIRMVAGLRYRFGQRSDVVNEIVDSEHPSTFWSFDNRLPARGTARDYAIVASYFDPSIEQRVLIVAGIGKSGTAAAAEFLATERYMNGWMTEAKLQQHKNVELVLSTDIVDGQHGPPRVIASSSW